MANYFKTIACPLCRASMSFEGVSTVDEDMRKGLADHLLSWHTREDVLDWIIVENIQMMKKSELIALAVLIKFGLVANAEV